MSIHADDPAPSLPPPPNNISCHRSFPELTRGSFFSELPEGILSLESSTTSYSLSNLRTRSCLENSERLVLCSSPSTDALKISLKRVPITASEAETLLEKRWELDSDFVLGSAGQKRTKSSILPTFVGDMGHCRASIPPIFAQLFGKTLFDNSIYKTPARQADLGRLEGKKFKTYRSKLMSDGWSAASADYNLMKAQVLDVLPLALCRTVTDSQVLAFLTLFPTRQALRAVLDHNPTLVALYFGQFDSNSARILD